MLEGKETRLVRDVAAASGRVLAGLASSASEAAYQLQPEITGSAAYCMSAIGHAEMLEREARNIRDAVAKFDKS